MVNIVAIVVFNVDVVVVVAVVNIDVVVEANVAAVVAVDNFGANFNASVVDEYQFLVYPTYTRQQCNSPLSENTEYSLYNPTKSRTKFIAKKFCAKREFGTEFQFILITFTLFIVHLASVILNLSEPKSKIKIYFYFKSIFRLFDTYSYNI